MLKKGGKDEDPELPILASNGVVFSDSIDLVGANRHIVDNSELIRLMRRHQNVFQFAFNNINSVWAYFGKDPLGHEEDKSSASIVASLAANGNTKNNNKKPYSMLDQLEIKVLTVSKLTCTGDFNVSHQHNCSNHGKCDFNSHKCICDKYWMPNLYLYYFNYESDLTNGNNCG